MSNWTKVVVLSALCLAAVGVTGGVYGNGGPFVIKYPEGDPAVPTTPLVQVSAAYTIENPADKEVAVDFGFPILRGVYVNWWMTASPDVQVRMVQAGTDPAKAEYISPQMITNSVIYGVIRQRAREAIDKAVADNTELSKLSAAVKVAAVGDRASAKKALTTYLTGTLKWNERDAALMAEYAGLELDKVYAPPPDASPFWSYGLEPGKLTRANLDPLAAIGEQKATQFFAQLANGFDPKAGAAYEAIFSAWGGDVREQSVDLRTGKVRPREITVDPKTLAASPGGWGGSPAAGSDPTVSARVDYLDETAKITDDEKAACRATLKNLPVVFTFAPMNLLHYQAKFPAKATVVLTVSYRQYAYADTAEPASCQMAYVLHPASMWKEFGPINLAVRVPAGVPFRASVETAKVETPTAQAGRGEVPAFSGDVYRATIDQKTGELFLAVETAGWDKTAPPGPAKADAEGLPDSATFGVGGVTGGTVTIDSGAGTLTTLMLVGGGTITGPVAVESGVLKPVAPTTQPEGQ